MSAALDAVSWFSMVAGGLLMVVSGLGMVRLPDLFTRLHAAGIADTGGSVLLLLGMALQTDFDHNTVKLVLIGIVLLLTTPTASHAVAHSALLGGLSPDDPAANRDYREDEDPDG